MNDRGSISKLILGLIGMAVVLGLMLGTAGRYLSVQSQTQSAADAAALAAAPVTFRPFGTRGNPALEASRLAAANGARLILCDCPVDRSWSPRVVEVAVERDVTLLILGSRKVTAVAAAEFAPVELVLASIGTSGGDRIKFGS